MTRSVTLGGLPCDRSDATSASDSDVDSLRALRNLQGARIEALKELRGGTALAFCAAVLSVADACSALERTHPCFVGALQPTQRKLLSELASYVFQLERHERRATNGGNWLLTGERGIGKSDLMRKAAIVLGQCTRLTDFAYVDLPQLKAQGVTQPNFNELIRLMHHSINGSALDLPADADLDALHRAYLARGRYFCLLVDEITEAYVQEVWYPLRFFGGRKSSFTVASGSAAATRALAYCKNAADAKAFGFAPFLGSLNDDRYVPRELSLPANREQFLQTLDAVCGKRDADAIRQRGESFVDELFSATAGRASDVREETNYVLQSDSSEIAPRLPRTRDLPDNAEHLALLRAVYDKHQHSNFDPYKLKAATIEELRAALQAVPANAVLSSAELDRKLFAAVDARVLRGVHQPAVINPYAWAEFTFSVPALHDAFERARKSTARGVLDRLRQFVRG